MLMAWIPGSNGDDSLVGTNGADYISGGNGDDTIVGKAGNDTIYGGNGDDLIYAGDGYDKVYGGDGDDTIYGGGDNDVLDGGDDEDVFIVNLSSTPDACGGTLNTTVDGDCGGKDFDTLDFSALLQQGFEIKNFVKNPETNGQPGFNGQIQLYNSTTNEWANINYHDIEKFVPCFTPGAMIATPGGEKPVESLRPGDKVLTRDNGIQEIRWTGQRDLSAAELAVSPNLRPVLIRAGALGRGLPERDMMVSPNHRMLVSNERTSLYFEEHEVLVAAKHLVDNVGVKAIETLGTSYIHFMFDRHEVVLADGTWTESFQPGDQTLDSMGREQRAEIFTLFPELREKAGRQGYVAARKTLKRHEAAMLRRA